MELPCEWCVKVEEKCQRKACGPGCEWCTQWKVGCSAVGLKRKGGERKAEQKVMIEDVEEGSVVSLELSDGVMEKVEIIAKELGNINRGIWALVAGVGKLMEVMEWAERKDGSKVDKEVETEGIEKVNRGVEMEIMLEEESEDGEDEEEKSEGEKERMEKDGEDKEEKVDRDGEN
jgi:hypothetical protein